MRLIIVTGMSGSGKTTALKMLEDAGFYCVDNIPLTLVEKFVELIAMPENEIDKMVLGLDVRADLHFEEAHEILKSLKEKGVPLEILFLDSDDNSLINRYKETRRLHPLAPYGRVEDGVAKEREILEDLRKDADYVLDTTNLLTRELKAELDRIFVQNETYNSLMVTVTSFGFKYGIPNDADLVFDVRFLPNPYYIDGLRSKTGNDKEIQDFVMSHPESGEFLDKLTDMVQFLIPNYVKEGKYRLVIAIGCTGGRHRSVTLANALYDRLKDKGEYGIKLDHRDIYNKRG
ncbi:MAG: RNase adapter RapZ [Lachnospiraceae bacterium]|nr:RNase adapter RapZ [Lachnospiraceae bacterium]